MIWLDDPTSRAAALPAAWLVRTPRCPASQPERTALRRSVAARILAVQFGREAESVELAHDAAGRPFIVSMPEIGISYATRGGWVLVALGAGRIGADVEVIEPLHDIPWNVLHARERMELLNFSAVARTAAFYRLWTAKEAFLKAMGEGLLREPSGFALQLSGAIASCADDPRIAVETRMVETGARSLACAVAFQG